MRPTFWVKGRILTAGSPASRIALLLRADVQSTPTAAPRVRQSPYEAVVPPAARPHLRNEPFFQGSFVARNDSYNERRPQSRRLRADDALADAIDNMRSRLDDDAPRGDAASQELSEAVGLLRSRMDVEARRTAADLATLEAALRLFGPRPGDDALTAARDAARASQRALEHASRGPALLHEAAQRRLHEGTSSLKHSVVASMASRDALDAAQHASKAARRALVDALLADPCVACVEARAELRDLVVQRLLRVFGRDDGRVVVGGFARPERPHLVAAALLGRRRRGGVAGRRSLVHGRVLAVS